MSFTFSIAGIEEEHGYELPCPDCGLSLDSAALPENQDRRNPDCSCFGHGGPEELPAPQFELNVATANGIALLRFLGLETAEYGEVDPADLLTALALKQDHADLLTVPYSHDARVIDGGRSQNQVERYFAKLTKIAAKAAEFDRMVVWG